MNQPNFTASSNDCARAIFAIVEKVTGQSLPMETCSRIVACVSIELKHSHAQLVEQNERMRQALTAAAGHFESHAHAMSATGWNLTAGVMKEQARECRSALNPPPTK